MTVQTEAAVTKGATITGRCVTNGTTHTGRVVEVIDPAGAFDTSRRFRIVTEEKYSNGARITPTVWHVSTEELAPELTLTDADGNAWHMTNGYGEHLDGYAAALAGNDVRWRRQFRVTFPRYSKLDVVRAAVAAAALPHERVVNTSDHWGEDDATVTTELIFPSSSWCMECGHDVRPDRYGRVSAYAVYRDPRGRSLQPTRNLDHVTAHRLAEEWLAGADDGRTAHVGIDACG